MLIPKYDYCIVFFQISVPNLIPNHPPHRLQSVGTVLGRALFPVCPLLEPGSSSPATSADGTEEHCVHNLHQPPRRITCPPIGGKVVWSNRQGRFMLFITFELLFSAAFLPTVKILAKTIVSGMIHPTPAHVARPKAGRSYL